MTRPTRASSAHPASTRACASSTSSTRARTRTDRASWSCGTSTAGRTTSPSAGRSTTTWTASCSCTTCRCPGARRRWKRGSGGGRGRLRRRPRSPRRARTRVPGACPRPRTHRETHPRTSSGGLRGVPVPVLVVGAKAELRRAGGTREASSFAEDDFFGGARAGGFDPSERAAAFVRRVCARVARALRLRPARWWRGVGGHDTREKGTSSSGALPTTMRDVFLRRVFSGDALAQTVGDDAFDSRAARDGGCCAASSRASALGASETTARGTAKTRAKPSRVSTRTSPNSSRDARARADAARPDDFGAASSAASTAPFAAHFPQSGNTAFSFPGTAGAHTATLRGGAGGGGAATGMGWGTAWTRGPRRLSHVFRSNVAIVHSTC